MADMDDQNKQATELDEKIQPQVYKQDYSPQPKIEGVQLIPLKNMVGDEGDFCELLRFRENGELETVPGFIIAQINRTHLFAQSIKAWHVHLKQQEIWYVPPAFQLFVGLWDLRKNSPSYGYKMRFNLGGGNSQLLLIPPGVAHGSANFSSRSVELFYFVDQKFNIKNPDENRIHWDAAGKEFWTPERD